MTANKGKHFYGYARVNAVGIAAVALGSVTELPVFSAPFRCRIKKLSILPSSAITGAATNNFGVRYKNKGSGGTGTSVIATKTFSSGINGSANDDVSLGAITDAYALLNQNDVVTFEKFENGSGLAMPALTAIIEYVRA